MTVEADTDYTVCQASYDLRKLQGKHLVAPIGRSRRYEAPEEAARTMAGRTVLRTR